MYKVKTNLMLKNDNGTLINEDLSQMIALNPNKQYFLMLYKYGFSNIFANITQNLVISPSNSWVINGSPISEVVITAPLVADITYLLEKIQAATNDLMILKINPYGKVSITFDSSVSTVSISSADLGILATNYLGNFTSAISSPVETISPKVPIISPFNYMVLTCNLVGSSSYIKSSQNDKLIPTTAICNNSAALEPFEYVEYVSRTNVIFPIDSGNIQRIQFELLDENLNQLIPISGASVDFNVSFAIVELL